MKRKWMLTLFVLIMSIGLMACNTEKAAETVEGNDEVVEESQISETVLETVMEGETEKETETEVEEESTEVLEQEPKISWYMDEEGLKNEELGISIKRDNGIFEEMELMQNVGVFTPHESGNGGSRHQNVFKCKYYDGEFENYISEYGMQKGTVNGVEYAYKDWQSSTEVAIGGNGIIFYTVLHTSDFNEGETVNDYLSRIDLIKPCNDFKLECLSYITEDGLYCPTLGISMSCVGTEHSMNRISIYCTKDDYSASITVSDESVQGMGTMYYMSETNGAQEVVDKYVEGMIEPSEYKTVECVEIDKMVEEKIGSNAFLGRGIIGKYEWDESGNKFEEWFFYSDASTWSIDCNYNKQDGISYEKYLSVFETLE